MPSRSHIVSALLCSSHIWPAQAWLLPAEIRRAIAERNVLRDPAPVLNAAPRLIARDDRSDAAEELSEELEDLIDELEVFRADFSAFIASTTTPVVSSVSPSTASSNSHAPSTASSSSPAVPPMGNSKSSSIKAVTPNGRINSVAQFNPSINSQATLQDLASLCNNPQIDIISIGYITSFFGPNTHYPSLAFGPGCDTVNTLGQSFDGTKLPNCSALGAQILACQQGGKKILASLEVQAADMGFSSSDQAQSSALTLWRILGGDKSANANVRPLGYGPDGIAITVDGFEYYLNDDAVASSALNDYTRTFFSTLNGYSNADSARSYLLAASLPETAASFLSTGALQLVAWVSVRVNARDHMQKRSVFGVVLEELIKGFKHLLNNGTDTTTPLPAAGSTVAASTTSTSVATTTPSSNVMGSSTITSASAMTSSQASAPMTPPQNALFPGNTFYMSSASGSMLSPSAAHASSPAMSSSHSQLQSSSSTAGSSMSTSSKTTTSPPEPEESNDEVGSTDPPPDSGTSFSVIDAEETQSSTTSAPTPPPTTTAPPSTTSSDSDTTVVQTVEVTPVPAPPEQSSMRKRQAMQQSGPLLFVQVNVAKSNLVDDVGQTLSTAASEHLIGGVELYATAQEISGASIFGGVPVPVHHT